MAEKSRQLTGESGLACGSQSAEPCIRRGDAFLSLKAKRTVPQDTGGPTCCLHVSWLSQGVSPKSTHTHPIILEWLPPTALLEEAALPSSSSACPRPWLTRASRLA